MNIKKKLFIFDLDGTLLSDSQENTIPDNVRETIKELREDGHIIVLSTGRPWRATKEIYDSLDLDTVVSNYNGSFIHNPKDSNYLSQVTRLKLSDVIRILETDEMKKIANNIAIETPNRMQVSNNDDSKFTNAFLKKDKDIEIISPINWSRAIEDPIGVLVEINDRYAKNISIIKNWFNSRFGDIADFSYWKGSEGMGPILEMTSMKGRKDIALRKIARYYKIDIDDIIAFGDGYNDVEMLKAAGVGVAMANSSETVKGFANVVTSKTNKEGGVADFIKWYLHDGGEKIVEKTRFAINEDLTEEVQILQTPSGSVEREIED